MVHFTALFTKPPYGLLPCRTRSEGHSASFNILGIIPGKPVEWPWGMRPAALWIALLQSNCEQTSSHGYWKSPQLNLFVFGFQSRSSVYRVIKNNILMLIKLTHVTKHSSKHVITNFCSVLHYKFLLCFAIHWKPSPAVLSIACVKGLPVTKMWGWESSKI